MRSAFLIAGLVLIGLTLRVSDAAQKSPAQTSGTEIVIDGEKNLERFPEWYVWEFFFQALDPQPQPTADQKISMSHLHVRLGVSESELALLLREAGLFRESREMLRTQLRESKAALSGMSDRQVQDAALQLEMDYRRRILEARGRIYAELAPASLDALRTWINHGLRGTSVHLRGSAIKYFHLPW